MDTMTRNFFRHIFESLKSLRRNGWMTVASVSAVTITLILVGIFLSVIMNVTYLAKNIENDVDVAVYVQIGTSDADMKNLEKELTDIPHVDKVRFSSKQEQYNELVEKFGSAWKIFDEDENPLYNVFILEAENPDQVKQIQKEASKLANVERADYGGASSDKIFKIADAIKKWGFGASILLLFVAIFLISNTIRITIISRQREIQIMKLVGARNGFIRWPFFLEGGWIGLIGAIIPILLVSFGYRQVYFLMTRSLITTNLALLPPRQLIPQVDLLMVGIGFVIGSLGSILSMRRFLKI